MIYIAHLRKPVRGKMKMVYELDDGCRDSPPYSH